MHYESCALCPRQCGINRTLGQTGFCGCPDLAVVSKTMLHKWEEPALAGENGSGAIFFGGCNLKCRFCQNYAISRTPAGQAMDAKALRKAMEELIALGAENIDLVSPTPYVPTIAEALQTPLPVPVVYNCGGYDAVDAIRALDGKIDIYLPDMKYADSALAARISGAPDYPQAAKAAIREMAEQTGAPQWDGERLKKGVIIRHLILPGYVENSLKVLDWIGETFAPGQVLVSLMRQYTPTPGMTPPLDRALTQEEYQSVLSWMYLNGLEGFTQEEAAADRRYIPDF